MFGRDPLGAALGLGWLGTWTEVAMFVPNLGLDHFFVGHPAFPGHTNALLIPTQVSKECSLFYASREHLFLLVVAALIIGEFIDIVMPVFTWQKILLEHFFVTLD